MPTERQTAGCAAMAMDGKLLLLVTRAGGTVLVIASPLRGATRDETATVTGAMVLRPF